MGYLQKIILENFQKHEHLEVEFNQGVNILCGESDSGKTTILRAIDWIYFNGLKGDVVRKTGSKKTSVKVIHYNDELNQDVIVERIKSASINAYHLTVGNETKEFNTIGKEIPIEVQQALQVSLINVDGEKINLNIAKQQALPFLLDKSGTTRMKIFNTLTGNDISDKVLQSLNKDILATGREEKSEQERLESNKKELQEIDSQQKSLQQTYDNFSKQCEKLKVKLEEYEQLSELNSRLISVNKKIKLAREEIKSIQVVDTQTLATLKERAEEYEILVNLHSKLKTAEKNIAYAKEELKNLKVPKIDTKNLLKKEEELKKLIKIQEKLVDLNEDIQRYEEKITKLDVKIEKETKEYHNLLKEHKVCPTCKTELDEKKIKEIEL